jgi:hypothetical protein
MFASSASAMNCRSLLGLTTLKQSENGRERVTIYYFMYPAVCQIWACENYSRSSIGTRLTCANLLNLSRSLIALGSAIRRSIGTGRFSDRLDYNRPPVCIKYILPSPFFICVHLISICSKSPPPIRHLALGIRQSPKSRHPPSIRLPVTAPSPVEA